MTLIVYVFPKLRIAKDVFRQMSKKPCFRTLSDSQPVKGYQTLVKICMTAFLSYFLSLWGKLGRKMSMLVICELLGLFGNTLTADDKYSLCNRENLPQPIQIQYPKKQKTLSEFSAPFLKSTPHFKRHEIQISETPRFRTPFDNQHANSSQTLLKSAWQHFYHIFSSLWVKLSWKMSLLVIC